ncbi:hypothetical protein BD408DRAFT_178285 [Parasitella parasitica]|nr:hypothetical protein BD408DRAFT_178285 [Parasitella parasitica]
MSMGSLRTTNNYQTNGSLSAAGRPDMTNASQHMLYSTSSLSQRMDIDNSNKLTAAPTNNNNLSAYYANQQHISSLYNGSNSNINGFPPLPSPSSMTSSPNTPMLSPVRQTFSSQQQQSRHYSMSSSSTGSLPRYNAGRNSFDMISSPLTTATDTSNNRPSSVHPHMIPETNLYDQRLKDSNNMTMNDATTQGFSSSPNIGQLLNPVHPLNTNGGIKSGTMDSNTQFFQSMSISNATSTDYSEYSSNNTLTPANSTNNSKSSTFDGSRLASLSDSDLQQQQSSNNFYGGNYYYQRPQQQQPLTNTHAPLSNEDITPMFRNGTTLPPSSSMYNDKQNGPELGTELLILK